MIVIAGLLSSADLTPTNDPAAIVREKIAQAAQHCMAGNAEAVVADYAEDIILSYPGTPDQHLPAIRDGYRELCRGTGAGTVETTTPTFEELLVSGNMVVAKLRWTTHLRGMPAGSFRTLRDLQIWQQRNGKWQFVRGVHYPVKGSW